MKCRQFLMFNSEELRDTGMKTEHTVLGYNTSFSELNLTVYRKDRPHLSVYQKRVICYTKLTHLDMKYVEYCRGNLYN